MSNERIMLLGDTHGNLEFFISVLKKCEQLGVYHIYQTGDFGIWTHTEHGRKFLNVLEIELARRKMRVIFADGNHENFDELYAIPVDEDGFRRVRAHIWHAPRGHIWEHGQSLFMAMGGAHSIDGPGGIWQKARWVGNNWWPQESVTDAEVEYAISNMENWLPRRVDCLIAHDVPSRVYIPGINSYPMAQETRVRLTRVADVARPHLWAGGHYHFPFFGKIPVGPPFSADETDCEVAILTGEMNQQWAYLLIETSPFKVIWPKEGKNTIPNAGRTATIFTDVGSVPGDGGTPNHKIPPPGLMI